MSDTPKKVETIKSNNPAEIFKRAMDNLKSGVDTIVETDVEGKEKQAIAENTKNEKTPIFLTIFGISMAFVAVIAILIIVGVFIKCGMDIYSISQVSSINLTIISSLVLLSIKNAVLVLVTNVSILITIIIFFWVLYLFQWVIKTLINFIKFRKNVKSLLANKTTEQTPPSTE
jgi:hypothetical protein